MDSPINLFQVAATHYVPLFIPSVLVLLAATGIIWLLNRRSRDSHSHSRFRFQWLTLLIVIATTIALILTLPLQNDTRGQLLTLLGLLLTAVVTLSSPTIAANAMAGFMLRSLNNFSPGDYIRVGDHFGRVTEQDLFHTEIQTEDRDLLTLPNTFLATNPVKVIQASGTIVSAEVGLGYDIDHQIIEALLLEAAQQASLEDAFVQVMELGDFAVTYRVAGVLAPAKHLLSTRSLLRKQMMDHLHGHGIEIVSPNFMNQRQVKNAVIPERSFVITHEPDTESSPEDLIFDKAETAQQLKELKETFTELQQTMKELKNNGAKENDLTLLRYTRRLKALARAISVLEIKKSELREQIR